MTDLSVEISGLKLKNPVMLASGVWDISYMDLVDFNRLGGVVYKGLSLRPKEGNPTPRISETPCGVINSIGLENEGIDEFFNENLKFLKQKNVEVILNIFGESIDEFQKLSSKIRNNASAIEINISCPNVNKGGYSFGKDPDVVFRVTRAVCTETELPVIVKLTPAVTDIIEIALAAQEAGASGITAVNTYPGMIIDIETGKPLFEGISGGVSGPAIRPLSLYCVYELSRNIDIPVIGSGGITDYKDALQFLYAGASAIQLGSVIFNNPLAPLEIIDNIKIYMKNKGFSTIDEIRSRRFE